MKRLLLTLITALPLALALGACDPGESNELDNGQAAGGRRGPNDTQGGQDTTFDHSNDPGGAAPGADFQPAEPSQMKMVGSPEVTSRLHACGKMTIASLGNLIRSRGLSGGNPNGSQSAQQIFDSSGPALGAANYNGRVPEAPFASTSAMAKMFDIYTMGAYRPASADWEAPACPGTKVIGDDGKFTADGISCLIGKPATPEYIAIANDAIAKNPEDGAKIAIAAMLSAAHTCQ
jgi:hypothetical protein